MSKEKTKEEHTFISQAENGYQLHCKICDRKELIRPPMPVEVLTKWVDVFIRQHKKCSK